MHRYTHIHTHVHTHTHTHTCTQAAQHAQKLAVAVAAEQAPPGAGSRISPQLWPRFLQEEEPGKDTLRRGPVVYGEDFQVDWPCF